MELTDGIHLAYCTNIHRGESWGEIFAALNRYTLKVKERVQPTGRYAIGLRLGARAALELREKPALLNFQRWLDQHDCYVFTINGFPYGQFHGTRVKEQVYLPDWTTTSRLEYTKLLFEILAEIVPPGVAGSVSTVPCGFKELMRTAEQVAECRRKLWECVEFLEALSEKTGKAFHLGIEPEPLCVLENTCEVIEFFARLREELPNDAQWEQYLGINYDACHLAVEFEEAHTALASLVANGIKISKLHLSSALKVKGTPEAAEALSAFTDNVYFHQTIIRHADGQRQTYKDLPEALKAEGKSLCTMAGSNEASEWRIHYHVPLHAPPMDCLGTTVDHLLGVMDFLQAHPNVCSHLEMETYTWEVLPPALKNREVVEQLAAEYAWTLGELKRRGFKR